MTHAACRRREQLGSPGMCLLIRHMCMQSVAAVLQEDCSAIVTLQSSGISRPAQLDGRTYASYGARYEGRIVQQLIRNDGGKGEFQEATPGMLGIWNTLLKVCLPRAHPRLALWPPILPEARLLHAGRSRCYLGVHVSAPASCCLLRLLLSSS